MKPALIPTGLWRKAQGCTARATLGQPSARFFNPDGVVSSGGLQWAATPLGLFRVSDRVPKVARPSQPWAGGRNPFGIGRVDGDLKKMGAVWKWSPATSRPGHSGLVPNANGVASPSPGLERGTSAYPGKRCPFIPNPNGVVALVKKAGATPS